MAQPNLYLHVVRFRYVKESDVAWSLPYWENDTHRVVFNSGNDWTELTLTGPESVFSETVDKKRKEGLTYNQKFTGHIPMNEIAYPIATQDMFREKIIVLLELYNGEQLVVGFTHNCVKLEYELNSKEQMCKISFDHLSKVPAMIYAPESS